MARRKGHHAGEVVDVTCSQSRHFSRVSFVPISTGRERGSELDQPGRHLKKNDRSTRRNGTGGRTTNPRRAEALQRSCSSAESTGIAVGRLSTCPPIPPPGMAGALQRSQPSSRNPPPARYIPCRSVPSRLLYTHPGPDTFPQGSLLSTRCMELPQLNYLQALDLSSIQLLPDRSAEVLPNRGPDRADRPPFLLLLRRQREQGEWPMADGTPSSSRSPTLASNTPSASQRGTDSGTEPSRMASAVRRVTACAISSPSIRKYR